MADSHGLKDPAVSRLLDGVDEILHAGDVGDPALLAELGHLAPTKAVRGNIDGGPLAELPDEELVDVDGVRILVRHIVGEPGSEPIEARRSIKRNHPRVVVMGHTHQPLAEESGGVVRLNPGSCGPCRSAAGRTVGILEVGSDLHFHVTDVETGATVLDKSFPLDPQ